MKKALIWLSTIVCDQAGQISSKRLGFYWCLWMLSRAVSSPTINEIVIWAIVGLAFGLAGLTIPEWFSQKGINGTTTTMKASSTETTTIK